VLNKKYIYKIDVIRRLKLNAKLITLAAAISLSMVACGGGGGSSTISPSPTPSSYTPTPVPTSGSNIRVQITPGSSVCGYANAPCVTVTICQPGTNNCDTVNNVLLDTGSFGLRIFGSLLPNTNNSLTAVTSSGSNVSECVTYADGTGNWGPIKLANVTLNTTTTTSPVPIQIIDTSTGIQQKCSSAVNVSTPTSFQVNGILGVGPLQTDQGFGSYYTCNSSSCSSSTVTPSAFVTNPITQFSSGNNNGLTLTFAAIPTTGATGADGYGIFGVGSSSSNSPGSGTNVFQIVGGNSLTVNSSFNSTTYPSFLDTGSTAFYFATSFLPDCGGANTGFFCPTSNTAQTATMTGTNGLGTSTSTIINFNIGNANSLLASGNTAFSNIGAFISGFGGLDWGLPFYLGRTVYMVFAGNTATVNGVTLPASSKGYWIY
jgi:hypothetical protein